MNVSKQHRELCRRTESRGVKITRIERKSNKAYLVYFKDLLGRDRSCHVGRTLSGPDLFNAISDVLRIANDTGPLIQPVVTPQPQSDTRKFSGGKSRYRQQHPIKPPRVVKSKPDDAPKPRMLMGVEVQVETVQEEAEIPESQLISQNVATIKERMVARMNEFESRPEPVLSPSKPKPGDTMQGNGFFRHQANPAPVDRNPDPAPAPVQATMVKKKIRRKHLLNKDLARLTRWLITNWESIRTTEITMIAAAKMATKELGCNITSHNIGSVATDLGYVWPGVKPKTPKDPSVKLLLESICTIADHVQRLTTELDAPSSDLDRAITSLRDMAKVLA